jgi:hypothetical protein
MSWLPLDGIKVADFSELNPKLIYCSLSGFGQNGPWRGTPARNAEGRAVLQELSFAENDIERILRSAAARSATSVRRAAGANG